MGDKDQFSAELQELRERAERRLTPNGKRDIEQMSIEDIAKVLHELETRQIELELQNKELQRTHGQLTETCDQYTHHPEQKQAEKALRESTSFFCGLINAIPGPVLLKDPEGVFLACNSAFAHLYGVKEAEVCGKTDYDFVDKEKADFFRANDRKAIAVGASMNEEHLVFTDGSYEGDYEVLKSPMLDLEGNLIGVLGIARDITDRKRAEAMALESESRLREAQRMAQLGSWKWDIKTGDVEWSDELFNIFHLDPKEFTPKIDSILALSPWPEDHERNNELIKRATENHEQGSYEQRFLLPDKSIGYYFSTFRGIYDDDGVLVSMIGTAQDITERKRAEQALRESESRYRLLMEHATDVIWVVDAESLTYVYISPSVERVLGFTDKEWIGRTVSEAVTPASLEQIQATTPVRIERMMRGDSTTFTDEIEMIHKAGHTVWTEIHMHFVVNPNTSRIEATGILRDITERKRAEEALAAEQRLLTSLIESSPDSIYFKDRQSRFLRINKALAEKIQVQSPDDALGKTDFDFFGKDHGPQAYEDEQHLIATGEPLIDMEEREDWPDGRVTWVSSTKMPMRDNEGRIVGLMGISRDITERKEAEVALRDSERRFRTLFEGAAEGIAIADVESRTLGYVNPAICEMLGYTAEELTGMGVQDIHPAEDLPAVFAAFEAQARGEQQLAPDIPCLRKDGTVLIADINTAPVELDGQLCLVAFFTDVTERKEAEAERQRLERQLRERQRLASVGVLASGIGHEFNNILQAITGYCEIMLMEMEAQSTQRQNILEIKTAAYHAGELARELLAFSRQGPLECEVVDLNEVLRDSEPLLLQALDETTPLKLELDPQLKPIFADAAHIRKVVMNLVVNARDSMPDGGAVTLSTMNWTITKEELPELPNAKAGSFACFSVEDTGCGMNREQLAHIFDPFYTTKPVGQGTGLGLAVVYGMVQEHDGWMSVASEPGRGSVFTVFLPVQSGDIGNGLPEAKGPARREILLVADDAIVQSLAEETLMGMGYEVTLVETAQAAKEVFTRKNGAFDLLFMDVMLPDGNGIDLADALLERSPGLPVLLFSDCSDEEVNIGRITTSGYRCIKKPFGLKHFLAVIEQAFTAG